MYGVSHVVYNDVELMGVSFVDTVSVGELVLDHVSEVVDDAVPVGV